MSDNQKTDDFIKDQVAEILKKQADEKAAKEAERMKNIQDAQKEAPKPESLRQHPMYRSF